MPRCHRSLAHPHDPDLSRMLVVFIATGLAFMLLPGTLVGVLTLLKISSAHATHAADAGWIQAHGHAQIFGWLGTFILGIGYYTIPRLRLSAFSRTAAWTTYALWTGGVAMRWAVGTFAPAYWRVPFAMSGVMELVAVVVFAVSVLLARPRATADDPWRASVRIITAAGCAFVVAVAVTAAESIRVARLGGAPAFAFDFDQRYLTLITWGFVVPFIWGFSTRWLPPLVALRPTRKGLLAHAMIALFAGVIANNAAILSIAVIVFAIALRIFEAPAKEPKLTPLPIRAAYSWSIVAAAIAMIASLHPMPNGYAGASRHALTVGFFAASVFTIGPKILPAFFNVRRLWSTRLMAASLVLLHIGCAARVVSQILAYESIAAFAWKVLPFSAVIELAAIILFTVNMLMTVTTGSPLEEALKSMTFVIPSPSGGTETDAHE